MNSLIHVQTIPHKSQRYNTIGDWYWREHTLIISVSEELPGWTYIFLVVIHEIIEALICYENGTSEVAVTEWDLKHLDADEPGDLPGCPYRFPHKIATMIEFSLALFLNVNWDSYERVIKNVCKN